MHVPQLQKGECNQPNKEHPCLPPPELIVAGNSKQEKLDTALCEEQAHAREDAGYGCVRRRKEYRRARRVCGICEWTGDHGGNRG